VQRLPWSEVNKQACRSCAAAAVTTVVSMTTVIVDSCWQMF